MVSLISNSPGTSFARYVGALARCKGDLVGAADFAFHKWRVTPTVSEALVQMAMVGAGDPNDPTWASPLVSFGLAQDFLQAVRARSVVDRLTGTRRAPFNTRVPVEVTGGGGGWIGPGLPIPLAKSAFENISLTRHKAGVLIALTEELLQSLSPAAISSIKESLIAGVTHFLDQQFLDPSIAAVANVSPASVTNGGVEIISSGSTAAAITADLSNMISAADADMTNPTWVMRGRTCAHIAGTLQIPDIKVINGSLFGIPIITSKSQAHPVGSPSNARYITLIDTSAVVIADDGAIDVSISDATSLQMADNPVAGAQSVTSLFQTNAAVARVIREITWMRTRSTAAVYMEVAF